MGERPRREETKPGNQHPEIETLCIALAVGGGPVLAALEKTMLGSVVRGSFRRVLLANESQEGGTSR